MNFEQTGEFSLTRICDEPVYVKTVNLKKINLKFFISNFDHQNQFYLFHDLTLLLNVILDPSSTTFLCLQQDVLIFSVFFCPIHFVDWRI